jgi:hypothetical protein
LRANIEITQAAVFALHLDRKVAARKRLTCALDILSPRNKMPKGPSDRVLAALECLSRYLGKAGDLLLTPPSSLLPPPRILLPRSYVPFQFLKEGYFALAIGE